VNIRAIAVKEGKDLVIGEPWTVTLRQQFAADAELIDEICAENEKSSQHLR